MISRRNGTIAAVATLTVAAAVLLRVGAERSLIEPPNYTQVEPGLWLGGSVAEPPAQVTAVLNLCESKDRYVAEAHSWEPIRDAEPAPDLEWLAKRVSWIETQRAAGRDVFVHCQQGVSRSGMLVTAYLMRRDGLTRDQALVRLRAKRPELRPHPAFMLLLEEWQAALEH